MPVKRTIRKNRLPCRPTSMRITDPPLHHLSVSQSSYTSLVVRLWSWRERKKANKEVGREEDEDALLVPSWSQAADRLTNVLGSHGAATVFRSCPRMRRGEITRDDECSGYRSPRVAASCECRAFRSLASVIEVGR